MRKLIGLGALFAASITFGACTYIAAVPSVQGHAYVVRDGAGTSDFWNCDATSGEPVCYQAKKKYQPPTASK